MLKKHSILATAAMTVLVAFGSQADAGHGGSAGGGGGGSVHMQSSGGNSGMRQSSNFQPQHTVSNTQSNAFKVQTNHGNVLSSTNKLPNMQTSNIHLANNVNHSQVPKLMTSNVSKNGNGLGISSNNMLNKGMNGQNNFKQNCSPWGYGCGKYNGCWGNYGGCYGNYGSCYNNYGYGCGYGYGYSPCGYSNWGYGCGNWGYTCGYYPRYYTCYSYPVVQPCPVVSSCYVPTTQVVTTVPAVSSVVVNETVAPIGSLALSNVAIPPSPVQ